MIQPIRRTKEQELTEQLILEQSVRIGLCVVLKNLVEEHAKLLGSDQGQTLAAIETGLQKTASSLNVKARDVRGGSIDISAAVKRQVEKMLNAVFREIRKKHEQKSVH
jgi:hypothetical protein